jgi:hypothetical protein
MSDIRSLLRRRGALVAVLAALAALLAASALSAAAAAGPASPPVICQRLPLSGLLPPGQTASTQFEASNQWQWSASSAHQAFVWKLIRRDGAVVASGSSPGPGGSIFVPFNSYRWQVTNHGNVGQWWRVCWSSGPART